MKNKNTKFLFDKHIYIKGAREHNLKNINIEIPRDKLVVITGLSGSGKSSLFIHSGCCFAMNFSQLFKVHVFFIYKITTSNFKNTIKD